LSGISNPASEAYIIGWNGWVIPLLSFPPHTTKQKTTHWMMPSDTDKRRPASLININKRSLLVLIGLSIFCTIAYFFSPGNSEQCNDSTTLNPPSPDTSTTTIIDAVQGLSSPASHPQVTFQNLNENDHSKEETVAIMVVLPPWAISPSLESFFHQLAQQTHTATRLSLLILNPASPTTIYTVRHYLSSARLHCPVDLYTKTYDTLTPWIAHDDHHDTAHTAIYELAPLGKSAMARAKNFLVQSSLAPSDRFVLWLDPLLTLLPTSLVAGFVDQCKTENVDILVPNTMIRKDGVEWGYDRSNWQETTMSTSLQDTVPVDFVFMEGKKKR
jgi:hypothetical protein